jgi:predicted O-linked N-acetylglucosamine transferase (SPINDLY family)
MATIGEALAIARGHYLAGRSGLAEEICRRVVAADAAQADAWLLLAVALHAQARVAEAIPCFHRAAELRPDWAEAHYNLGTSYLLEKNYPLAIASLTRAQQLTPSDPQVLINLATAYRVQGDLEQALNHSRRALQLRPDDEGARNNLGLVLADLGRADEALACFQEIVAKRPDRAETHYNLANVLRQQGQPDAALAAYRRALALQPASVETHYNLGNLYREQGQPDEAIRCYQQALQLQPGDARIHDNLLSALHYHPGLTLADLAAAHREYDRLHAAPLRVVSPPSAMVAERTGPLRLGFVSADMGCHPVGRFLIRTLEALDRQACQVVCYNDRLESDAFTERFRAASAEWRDVTRLDDERLADRIHADQIQILFDLAGHTAQNRMLMFARRPAPVQITWIGYEGTTGLSAMDYLLGDRHLVPPEAERFYCERVLRLPDSYVCYDPPAEAPPVGPLPAEQNAGRVTFGSFNNPAKLSRAVVAVWAELLRRVPDARLLLKYRGMDRQSRIVHWFAEYGVDAGRIELSGWSPYGEYLEAYQQVDIALDPFPFNGGITTCDALWMGVPVVTCPGTTFASRHSLSHLATVDLMETVAPDTAAYVDLAAGLAEDLPRLARLRAGLRERMAQSPLCDGARLAENLLRLLRQLQEPSTPATL